MGGSRCQPPRKCNKIHTDFFAVRPEHVERQAFADWKSQPNAEWQATRVFRNMMKSSKRAVWLMPFNRDKKCLVRGGGLWHSRLTCDQLLQQRPWQSDI